MANIPVHKRVLLVDQNDDLASAFTVWLERSPVLELVGRARSGQEAIDQVRALAPEILLMEMVLPDMTGLEAMRRIKARPEAPRVILLTFHYSSSVRAEAIAAGADDCITKPEVTRTLLPAIERIYADSGSLETPLKDARASSIPSDEGPARFISPNRRRDR